ncbi:mucin-6-like [Discoglossus pictus]
MGFWSSRPWVQLLMISMSLHLMVQAGPCPPNMVYGCKRICYSNCDNLNSTTEACIKPCWLGCDCIPGYVFQSSTSNVCVPVSQCNVICPAHMTFNPCLTVPRPTCATLGQKQKPTLYCMPRCVCDAGYVLSNDVVPRCIKIRQCLVFPVKDELALSKV